MTISKKVRAIPDAMILNWLANYQGQWTSLWHGHFKGRENEPGFMSRTLGFVNDVFYAFPDGTENAVATLKMRALHRKGYVGGCPCGCRGDFEITDLGLLVIGKPRTKEYTGY